MQRPSNLLLLKRAFKQSISNLVRNKFLSTATVIVMGTILFIFNVILAVNFITESSLQSLSQKVDLVLYIEDSTNTAETQHMISELKLLDEVQDLDYTSKEEALSKVKNLYPNIYESFSKYDLANPLPASISIQTLSPDSHANIENYIKGSKLSSYITNIEKQADSNTRESGIISSVAQNLQKVTDFSRQIIFWVVIVFILGGILIILNAVQMAIFTRKKEIEIMRLVGAEHFFIKMPFVIEAIIYALGAVALNILMLMLLAGEIDIEGTTLLKFSENLNLFALTIFETIVTITIAICSSLIAVHAFLRRNT